MTPSLPEQAVLYVDLLGFAAMTMNTEDISVRIPPYETGNAQQDYGAGAPSFWTEKSPISLRLLRFHRRLEDLLHKETRSGDLRAMLFSDGAFIVAPDIQRLALLAGEIMRTCILERIPTRMGLAVGTFQPLKFAAETVGETGIYTSLFYGTGVVRAHFAERRGGKGMRIFIHPSVLAALGNEFTGFTGGRFEPKQRKLLPLIAPTEHSSHEFEYLYRRNLVGWHSPGVDGSAQEDQKLRDAVQQMKDAAPMDDATQVHYRDTLAALNRMRLALEREPFM